MYHEVERWTADDVPDLSGITAVVTGANSGVGFVTALELARKGAMTILGCRSRERGERALRRILQEAPEAKVKLMQLDLGDLDSVGEFARRCENTLGDLHLLVNNAGIMATPYRVTKDGFEGQFGTNHLGHFALTGRLMPLLLAARSARVVNVSSLAHRNGVIDVGELMPSRRRYNRWRAYGQSKLANLLFTYELQRRLDKAGVDGVAALAAHPGVAQSNIAQGLGWWGRLAIPFGRLFFQSAEMGALPILRAATDPGARGGEYYGPGGRRERRGFPVVVLSAAESYELETARVLWERSEELTGVGFGI